MPSTWRVPITGVRPGDVTARGLHAVVSSWLDGSDDAKHRAGRKPWTCSPLFADKKELAVEIGLIDDRLAAVLASSAAKGTTIHFGPLGAVVPDDPRPVAGMSWTQMIDGAVPRRSWRFRFVTPTAFRSGNVDQTMPQPGSVIGHYRRVWNEFAPDRDEANVDLKQAKLSVASLDGRTVEFMGRFGRRAGFVGEIEIQSSSNDEALRTRIDAVMAVAPFSGTGTDTTAGMGVTRWMD